MRETLLVCLAVVLAHVIVGLYDPSRWFAEPDHAGQVAEFNAHYRVVMDSSGAAVLPRRPAAVEMGW